MSGDVRSEPEDIDERWLTDALEEAGIAAGATLTSVEVEGLIGTGQTGRNARLRLTWDQPEGCPATLVGKFPSADPAARAAAFENGTYLTEWEFYSRLAGSVRVRTPACHVARFDPETPGFVLILEDLADCRQGDQFVGLTVDEAALAIEQAVGLHAPRWGDPSLEDFAAHRPKRDERAAMLGMVYGMMVEPFLDRLGPGLDDDVVDLVRGLVPLAGRWAEGTDTPATAVHLDFRPDNLMFGTTDDAPPLAVVDWQTVSQGHAMMDVAYVLGGSFEADRRAQVERDLLTDYRHRLAAEGIDYDPDAQWRDYRHGALWGVVMTVIATILAAETERGNEMLTVMGQRHGRHALELDSLALLA